MTRRHIWILASLVFIGIGASALVFGRMLFRNNCRHWKAQAYLVTFQWKDGLKALSLHPVRADAGNDSKLEDAAYGNARGFASAMMTRAQTSRADGQFRLYLCGCGNPYLVSRSNPDIPKIDQLMNAAASWDLPTVRGLVSRGMSVNARSIESGSTALIYAASDPSKTLSPARVAKLSPSPDPTTYEYLLSAGADPNARGYLGVTALMRASDASITRALLASGAAVNTSDDRGWTAVMYAVSAADFQKVESLIAAGAKIDSKDRDGWTPLMYATDAGAFHMVGALLKAGANANATNNKGETALDILRKKQPVSPDDRKIARLLKRSMLNKLK